MPLYRVVMRELVHHRWNAAAGLAALTLAVAVMAGSAMVLDAYQIDMEQALDAKQAHLEGRLAEVRADVRRSVGELGFDLTLVPGEQELGDWYVEAQSAVTMPEDYLQRLADSEVASLRQAAAQLRRRVTWPETEWAVIVVGRSAARPVGGGQGAAEGPRRAPGELAGRYVEPPQPGSVALGHEIHRVFGFEEGDAFELMGRTFRVARCLGQEGSRDDLAVYMPLADAQTLLGEPGRISEIVAQGTSAAAADLAGLREEISELLPGVQVVQDLQRTQAATLAELHVVENERAMLASEREAQADLHGDRRRLAALVRMVVVLSCGLWVGYLAWSNVAERRQEIGIWRACGVGAPRLVGIFLSRWTALGAMGTAAGLSAAAALAPALAGVATAWHPLRAASVLGVAVLLSGLAAATAAVAAARQDPAATLRSG